MTRLEKERERERGRDERMSITGVKKNVGTIKFSGRVSKIRGAPEDDSNIWRLADIRDCKMADECIFKKPQLASRVSNLEIGALREGPLENPDVQLFKGS